MFILVDSFVEGYCVDCSCGNNWVYVLFGYGFGLDSVILGISFSCSVLFFRNGHRLTFGFVFHEFHVQ